MKDMTGWRFWLVYAILSGNAGEMDWYVLDRSRYNEFLAAIETPEGQ